MCNDVNLSTRKIVCGSYCIASKVVAHSPGPASPKLNFCQNIFSSKVDFSWLGLVNSFQFPLLWLTHVCHPQKCWYFFETFSNEKSPRTCLKSLVTRCCFLFTSVTGHHVTPLFTRWFTAIAMDLSKRFLFSGIVYFMLVPATFYHNFPGAGNSTSKSA